MKSNDYKNGYNDCCEDILAQISIILNCHVDVNTSIGDSLRRLRQGILDKSFSRYEDDK